MYSKTDAFSEIEREAKTRVRTQRGLTGNLYVQNGGSTRLSEARAVAEALENDPEIYTQYKQAHNARPVLEQLRAAGVIKIS